MARCLRDCPSAGFSSGAPWLPLGPAHRALSVSQQEKDAASPLAFTRSLLAARKANPALRDGSLTLLPGPLLALLRENESQSIVCVFNLGEEETGFDLPGPARALKIGTGEARLSGARLTLGPGAAWFGLL